MNLFSFFKRKPKRVPVTHNFGKIGWGHHMETMNSLNAERTLLKVYGHTRLPLMQGDTAIMSMKEGDVPWLIEEIRWCDDPRDMFFATIKRLS
jgi:hypothetical protein